MTLQERVDYLTKTFNILQSTNSRIEKEFIVSKISEEIKDDFNFIIEILSGKHPFGYKFVRASNPMIDQKNFNTVKEMLEFLLEPIRNKDLTQDYIWYQCSSVSQYADFLEPIVNRTLRLGIGNSLLEKTLVSPMLAKKFEGNILTDKSGYFITEKLDGNRCIAMHDGVQWHFYSRNGKEMFVNFDMSSLPTQYIYDGEVLSPSQVDMSRYITDLVQGKTNVIMTHTNEFNNTSGLINRHDKNKNLIYNIFDIVDYDNSYEDRREVLTDLTHCALSKDIRILPLLAKFNRKEDLYDAAPKILDTITSSGGEGLMINLGSSGYLQKRTDKLLKFKKMYTADMEVLSFEYGSGKYEFDVGALYCEGIIDGKSVSCKVGTGISDEQRFDWSVHPEHIIGKIVEIGYFSLSQNMDKLGSNSYSLRFPRLKRVREDKNDTNLEI